MMAHTAAGEHGDWMWDRLSIILHGSPLALPPPRAELSYVDVRHYLNQSPASITFLPQRQL